MGRCEARREGFWGSGQPPPLRCAWEAYTLPILLRALPTLATASEDRRQSGGADAIELAGEPAIGGVRPIDSRLFVTGSGIAVGDAGILALVVSQPARPDDQEGGGGPDRGEGAGVGDTAIVMATAGAVILGDAIGMSGASGIFVGDELAELGGKGCGALLGTSFGMAGEVGGIDQAGGDDLVAIDGLAEPIDDSRMESGVVGLEGGEITQGLGGEGLEMGGIAVGA